MVDRVGEGMLLFQILLESQNHLGWKRPPRSLSTTSDLALTSLLDTIENLHSNIWRCYLNLTITWNFSQLRTGGRNNSPSAKPRLHDTMAFKPYVKHLQLWWYFGLPSYAIANCFTSFYLGLIKPQVNKKYPYSYFRNS